MSSRDPDVPPESQFWSGEAEMGDSFGVGKGKSYNAHGIRWVAGETYKCVIIKYSHSGSEVYFLKFQFFERDKSSVLNLKCVGIAKQVHQDIIVKIRYHSRAGIVHSLERLSCHMLWGSGTVEPYQCLYASRWIEMARLPRGQQVLHQRWIRCKWENPPWLWNPRQTSPEVQNRDISGPTKKTGALKRKTKSIPLKFLFSVWLYKVICLVVVVALRRFRVTDKIVIFIRICIIISLLKGFAVFLYR